MDSSETTGMEVPSAVEIIEEKRNRLPFNMNLWALYTLYLLYTFFCGCCYWGFDGLQDTLYKAGAYVWECPTSGSQTIRIKGNTYTDCSARIESINNLYTVAFSSHFVSSAGFGLLLDYAGPKITACTGVSLAGLAWILIAFSSETAQMYIPGFMFLGMSADPCFLPLLSISNLNPKYSSGMMSLLGGMRSVSFAMPVIISLIYFDPKFGADDMWKVVIGYVCLCLGFCLCVAILFVPNEPFFEEVRADSTEDSQTSEEPPKKEKKVVELIIDHDKKLKDTLLSWEFLLILPFFCLGLIRNEFYTKNNKQQLKTSDGKNVLEFFRVMNPLSAIPGPFFGALCDVIGCLNVIGILNIAGIFLYVFIIPDNIACKGISVFFFFIYCSFCLSNLYVYVATTLPRKHFGKLTGIASAIAGAFCLISMPLTIISVNNFDHLDPYQFAPVNSIMIGFGLINCVIWVVMYKVKQMRIRESVVKNANDLELAPTYNLKEDEETRVVRQVTAAGT